MSKPFNWFTTNGHTTPDGQRKWGTWEAVNYSQPSYQQAGESWSAYTERMNAYNATKNGGY